MHIVYFWVSFMKFGIMWYACNCGVMIQIKTNILESEQGHMYDGPLQVKHRIKVCPDRLLFTIVYNFWNPCKYMIMKTHWIVSLCGELPVSAASWILITSFWFDRTSGGLSQFVHCEPHGVRELVFNSNHWILIIHINTCDSFVLLLYFFLFLSIQILSKNLSRVRFWAAVEQ